MRTQKIYEGSGRGRTQYMYKMKAVGKRGLSKQKSRRVMTLPFE